MCGRSVFAREQVNSVSQTENVFNGALEMGSRGRSAGETSCIGTPQFYRLRPPYRQHHSKMMLLGHLRAMWSDIQHNTHIYEECTLPSLCMQTGPVNGSDDCRGPRPIPKPRNVISTEGEPEGGETLRVLRKYTPGNY